jgi:hypothetical protein
MPAGGAGRPVESKQSTKTSLSFSDLLLAFERRELPRLPRTLGEAVWTCPAADLKREREKTSLLIF